MLEEKCRLGCSGLFVMNAQDMKIALSDNIQTTVSFLHFTL